MAVKVVSDRHHLPLDRLGHQTGRPSLPLTELVLDLIKRLPNIPATPIHLDDYARGQIHSDAAFPAALPRVFADPTPTSSRRRRQYRPMGPAMRAV
jgi:hypothetical protein